MEHRGQVQVICPQCHWSNFMEVNLDSDNLVKDSTLVREIRSHLEKWMASQCPDHLGLIMKLSKN